jgi:hypothetical protein
MNGCRAVLPASKNRPINQSFTALTSPQDGRFVHINNFQSPNDSVGTGLLPESRTDHFFELDYDDFLVNAAVDLHGDGECWSLN